MKASISIGFATGSKRPTTLPLRSITNLVSSTLPHHLLDN